MRTSAVEESTTIDGTDRALIRALQLAPRGSFSRIGEVLGLSEQTVARRYRRLCREGVLRVVALVDPAALGQSTWTIRVRCRPDGTAAIADALARRDDVGWVALSAAGSEVTCAVRSRTREQRDDLLLQRLPRTSPVLGISAAVMLHRFIGQGTDDWGAFRDALAPAQARQLAGLGSELPEPPARGSPARLEPGDEPMIELLSRSGRASYAELAAAAGISEGRAARRLAALLGGGLLYLDVDLSAPLLGFAAQATLWLTVAPASLDRAGRALRDHPQVAFAAAVSGPANLTASVTCRDLDELYRFATAGVGAIAGVQAMEISPVMRHVKQAGAIRSGNRLMDAPAPVRAPRARRAGR